MQITSLYCKGYKGFRDEVRLALRPLTVLLGKNNAGKSVLARLPLLLLGGLASEEPEPVPLKIRELEFGGSTLDLIYSRSPHGAFELGGTFVHDGSKLSVQAEVQHVAFTSAGRRTGSEFSFVSKLQLAGDVQRTLAWDRTREQPPRYGLQGEVRFAGLLPRRLDTDKLDAWHSRFDGFLDQVSYLGPLRERIERDIRATKTRFVGSRGENAPYLLAEDHELLQRVAAWYRQHLDGWSLELEHSGPVFSCMMRLGERESNLADTGEGFGQVLPVLIQQLQHRSTTSEHSAFDIVEHPELHLHPAAHAALADLYVDTVVESGSRVLVETHSENFLLRLRRRVAEGRLSPDDLALYWVDEAADASTSTVRQIEIGRDGSVAQWPSGVFSEGYDEVRALRRAARRSEALGS